MTVRISENNHCPTTRWGLGAVVLMAGLFVAAGCGGKHAVVTLEDAAVDGGDVDGEVEQHCGNAMVEGTEECDDGNRRNDDYCRDDCTWACGDGELQPVEACDTAIPAGEPGACPTECDDNDPCTTNTLSGTACDAECVYGEINVPIDDDDCCLRRINIDGLSDRLSASVAGLHIEPDRPGRPGRNDQQAGSDQP